MWKVPLIIVLIGLSVWLLLPQTHYRITKPALDALQQQGVAAPTLAKLEDLKNKEYSSEKEFTTTLEAAEIEKDQIPALVKQFQVRKAPINLGLDLQGGVHLILEVDADKYVEKELVRVKDLLPQDLKKKGMPFTSITMEGVDRLKITTATAEELKKISDYIAKEVTNLEPQGELFASATTLILSFKQDIADRWKENAVTQALITIRNRVDEFGLTEPVIQRQGKTRIIIELAGEKDPERAIKIIGKTAELRFQLVKDFASTKEALLSQHNNKIPDTQQILPASPAKDSTEPRGYYLLEKEAKVTGANLKDARVSNDEMGMPAVSFELDRQGARTFAAVTEENIGNPLAIVLDDTVQTAPVIKSKIPDGQGQITGVGSFDEANDTALVLRAGALPAPIKILENLSVGPSLGEDSIQAGRRATLIGCAIVFIFMLVYYKFSGVIADLALGLNVLLILAALAYFKATLTLPGIAGIALTVGMAVDNNILIFERIKEELRIGKTFRSAAENGFKRAIVTILDANVTTLLPGAILFQFGTGAVKGFAVTLSIGIISTLFTAVIVSKVLYDLILKNTRVKRISI